MGFGIYLWQLSVPEVLQSYDTAVYLAASIHFVSRALPNKDFNFVQPPGFILLMSPVALIGRLVGTHDGYILARVASSFVTALNASMLAWLVRRRGKVAMTIAGAGLALLPVALFVSSSLEPDLYCPLFVLAGSIVIFLSTFEAGSLPTRTLALAGVLFGLAGW